MVKLQLAANAIEKSRSQIKPKPIKGLFINTILIFLWRMHQGVCASLLSNRRINEIEKELKRTVTMISDIVGFDVTDIIYKNSKEAFCY